MAYDLEELTKQSIEAIKKNRLYFIEDVVSFLPCTKGTFYNNKLHEIDAIKEALTKNKVNTKVSMRRKWAESDNATLQVALMKLIGTEDEAHRLNGTVQKIEHSGSGGIVIQYEDMSKPKTDD
jgi:hypothetical protein